MKWAVEVSAGGFKKLSFIAPGLGWGRLQSSLNGFIWETLGLLETEIS